MLIDPMRSRAVPMSRRDGDITTAGQLLVEVHAMLNRLADALDALADCTQAMRETSRHGDADR